MPMRRSQSKASGLWGNEPETAGKKVSAASADRITDTDAFSKEDSETFRYGFAR